MEAGSRRTINMAQAKTVGREVAANVVKETEGLTGESRDASKAGFPEKP